MDGKFISFNKKQRLEEIMLAEKKTYILQLCGILLICLGIFIFQISFLEKISFISPDHSITSLDAKAIIVAFRVIFIISGLLLLFAGHHLHFLFKKIFSFIWMQKRKNPALFYLAFLLFLLLFLYLFSIFFFVSSSELFAAENASLPDAGMLHIIIKTLFKTGLHFFRVFSVLLSASPIAPENIDIPVYNLYIKENNLDKLNANLPESGKEYVSGYLVFENETYRVKVRYRGDSALHWYFPKKSWRIKLKDHVLLNASNKFNIINPKYDSQMVTGLGYFIANNLSLIAPQDKHVALFVNNKYMGVYYYTDQIDELFMRMQGKVPGDIFYGELQTGSLFVSGSLWDIMVTGDNNETRAAENMDVFIQSINQSNLGFYHFFNQHLGDEYLQYYAYNIFIGDRHVDESHNHKFYFNPTDGIFEPIVWDQIPFSSPYRPLKADYNTLFNKTSLIPPLVQKKNEYLYQFIQELPEEEVIAYINKTADNIQYEMKYDLFKESPFAPWVLTSNEWEDAVEKLRIDVQKRYAYIKEELMKTNLTLFIVDDHFFVFDISGNSAITITDIKLDTEEKCIRVYKDSNFDFRKDENEREGVICSGDQENGFEILYPGKNAPLRYVYILEEQTSINIERVEAYNIITEEMINAEIIDIQSLSDLPSSIDTESLHPWSIPAIENKTVVLEGDIVLKEDMILNKGDVLIVKPNTQVHLGAGVSIISYGKVIAEGTAAMPISFIPADDEPWGAIALQGDGANNSVFRYCLIEGGSGAHYEMVHYTGMLSAYNTKMTLDHCTLKNNKKEDDLFNAKYSHVQITNSTFSDTFSDAIDIDISIGIIAENIFTDINGDAIDLMTSTPLIKNNYIKNASDKGISVGEMSTPYIINNTITLSTTGIALKDRSNATLINNTIISNTIGLVAYEKNWQYGGGGFGTIQGSDLCENRQPTLIQNSSIIQIIQNDEIIICNKKKCNIRC